MDVYEKKLLKTPDDRIQLKSVETYPLGMKIEFEVLNPKSERPMLIDFQRIRSWEETWLNLPGYDKGGGTWSRDSDTQLITFEHNGTEQWGEYMTNPLIFRIYDYGYDKIHQPFRVKVY